MADLDLVADFVNTAELEEHREDLPDARGLVRWFAAHRLLGEHACARDEDVAEARAVREALRELLRANNGVVVDAAAAAATLDAAGRRAGLTIRFDTGAIRFVPGTRGVHGALGGVLAAAAEAMADGSWQRLKACRSDTCRWAFVDNARNRSRQWCSMSSCGNRSKARTFRQRHHA
jgi:predicted RNA-binding Zn ribbon-like protein